MRRREIDHWVLLSTCDHDGLVSGYRTLKGMTEVQDARPTLSRARAIGLACRRANSAWPVSPFLGAAGGAGVRLRAA